MQLRSATKNQFCPMKTQFKGFSPIIALLIKMSGIAAVDARGKVGGSVFSKSRAGAYVRNKVTPVNRRSPAQQAVRSVLAFFSQKWRSLTQSQINGWNSAANTGFKTTNIFGDTVAKSGIGLYTGLNMNLTSAEQATIDDAPIQGAVGNMISIDPEATVTGSTMFIKGVNDAAGNTVTAGNTLVIIATAPVSAGISFVKSQFRIIGNLAAAANTDTSNLWTMYVAKFGAPPAGSKIFIGCTAVNNDTGQAGVPLAKPVIVGA